MNLNCLNPIGQCLYCLSWLHIVQLCKSDDINSIRCSGEYCALIRINGWVTLRWLHPPPSLSDRVAVRLICLPAPHPSPSTWLCTDRWYFSMPNIASRECFRTQIHTPHPTTKHFDTYRTQHSAWKHGEHFESMQRVHQASPETLHGWVAPCGSNYED